MIYQQLQPINDQQQPVQISPDYTFTSLPQTKCIYHPKFITHFCKKTSCLMPLCDTCLGTHSPQHSKFIDSIQNTLTQVYRGYAKRANEIALHQRHDFLQLRQDLHKLIDAIFEDLLRKADQNYQPDLVFEWRNLISKLEKLKDSQTCMKEAILYFVEPDQGYHEPQLTYQNNPIQINQFSLQQVKLHLNRLFTVASNNGEFLNLRDNEWQEDNPIRRVSSIVDDSVVYSLYNYTDSNLPNNNINNKNNNNNNPNYNKNHNNHHQIDNTPAQFDQSPIRLVLPIEEQYTIQSPAGIQYAQPIVRTPYTVPSVYTISTVRPFKQSREFSYAFPYVQ
ncbi:unnamed protein product [Paramecium octaurelia]|uniref:Uncharacterized protein n=1 Tax=Paramecium octaurelia TaxID=43137 RepID=A0A8S1YFS8_PAROT|nr:unnamed protein product [Paramecium octaurelia]